MSDENAKSGQWTMDAKFDFLMRVIAVTNDNKPIPWSKINIPGRTTKSLQNMWTKINKDLAVMRAASADTEVSTTTPRKRGPNKKTDDADGGTPKPAKKRSAPTPKSSTKKAKKEEPAEDVKDESDDTEALLKSEAED